MIWGAVRRNRGVIMGWFRDVGSDWPAMWVDRRNREPQRDWLQLVAELIRDAPNLGPHAACRSVADPSIFDLNVLDDAVTAAALACCAGCGVRARCRTAALRRPDAEGVLGGLVFTGGAAYTADEWFDEM